MKFLLSLELPFSECNVTTGTNITLYPRIKAIIARVNEALDIVFFFQTSRSIDCIK